MDANMILMKSLRGREEIETRAYGLPALERRLLIVANGQSTVHELAEQLDRSVDDEALQQALDNLIAGHFVHVLDEYDLQSG